MSDPWPSLAERYGRKAVMSLTITDAELDAETDRQSKVLFPLVEKRTHGLELTALDFGCGAGRFTRPLNRLLRGTNPLTVGYDPCRELVEQAPIALGITWESGSPEHFFFTQKERFDIAFAAMVLCLPGVDPDYTAEGLARVLSPNGLMILVDHMADRQPNGKWVSFRSEVYYQDLFARYNIRLQKIGEDRQLDNKITVMAGRKL